MSRLRVVFIGQDREFSRRVYAAVAEAHEIVGVVESWQGPEAGEASGPNAALDAGGEAPVFFLSGSRHEHLAEFLRGLSPDAVCAASCAQVLRAEALSVPRLGCLNLHPSLLPKFRGPNPWFWHFYHMEAVGGVTAHRMTPSVNAGPILRQAKFSTPLGMDFAQMEAESGRLAGHCALRALEDMAAGAPGRPQEALPGLIYARRVSAVEKLIDWENWPLERVWHVLKGTRRWLNVLPSVGGWRSWRVGGVERGPASTAGRISRDGAGWFIGHRAGKIRLTLDYDWPQPARSWLTRLTEPRQAAVGTLGAEFAR